MSDTELLLLREFFDAWLQFHAVAQKRGSKRQVEMAAQELTDCKNAILLFRNPVQLQTEIERSQIIKAIN